MEDKNKNSRAPITGPISLSVAVRWDDWGVNTKLISKNWLVPTPLIPLPASPRRGTAVSPVHRCTAHASSRLLPTASSARNPSPRSPGRGYVSEEMECDELHFKQIVGKERSTIVFEPQQWKHCINAWLRPYFGRQLTWSKSARKDRRWQCTLNGLHVFASQSGLGEMYPLKASGCATKHLTVFARPRIIYSD